jgi:hypothetical protein
VDVPLVSQYQRQNPAHSHSPKSENIIGSIIKINSFLQHREKHFQKGEKEMKIRKICLILMAYKNALKKHIINS